MLDRMIADLGVVAGCCRTVQAVAAVVDHRIRRIEESEVVVVAVPHLRKGWLLHLVLERLLISMRDPLCLI